MGPKIRAPSPKINEGAGTALDIGVDLVAEVEYHTPFMRILPNLARKSCVYVNRFDFDISLCEVLNMELIVRLSSCGTHMP